MKNKNFHTLSPELTAEQLGTVLTGLNSAEAAKRLVHYGRNELQEKKKKSLLKMFLLQFADFMIVILLIAAIVSAIIGEKADTIIILVIVFVNAIISFFQEYRTEKAIEALKKMSSSTAHVQRDSVVIEIPVQELVIGDLVLLEAGNAIPADLRLIEAHSLRIDESALTGESVAVDKSVNTISTIEIPLGDRFNMAYKGTLVTNGRALGLVVATGMKTELGKIAGLLQQDQSDTPLKQRMTSFGKKLTYSILLICVIIFVTGLLRGEEVLNILLVSISLAVAAIPEAMPALMTVALAMGAKRMAAKNALVRKLPAVETLGSVSFICSDKTGTLTLNKMKVTQKFDTEKKEDDLRESPLILAMTLNHDVNVTREERKGESTELAIVDYVIAANGFEKFSSIQNQFPRSAELPFDSDRKRMSTIHKCGNKFLILCKGAPESIAHILKSEEDKNQLKKKAQDWAKQGLRVLAFSYKILNEIPDNLNIETVEVEMNFCGLTGIIDPPREEVKQAIAECKRAGIKAVMITGDHPATAAAIAKEIGILTEGDRTLTGEELHKMSESDFLEQVEFTSVYARVSPEQKIRIVKTLQKKNHFVAMTGDGVNDAPSLRAANIGIAMGINGTDVSKEASEMILLDDNFATIIKAVKEGRRIYDNIRKFVKYIMTCNSAEIWTIFLAPLVGLPMPLLPIHILWINLVTDGLPGIALAGEKPERDIMNRLPRPAKENLFAQGLGFHILWVGLLMGGLTLGVQAWAIGQKDTHWQTMVFTTLALIQLGHALAVRSERSFLYRQGFFSNKPMAWSIILTVVLQACVIYLPFMNTIFKTQPLDLKEVLICIGASAILFHAVEAEKWIKRRFIEKKF